MHKSLKKIKVPLILGVWGGKGQGKTFQVTLAFKAMNAEPIIMSAGELEAGNAGEPAKLVRQRYREAGMTSLSPPGICPSPDALETTRWSQYMVDVYMHQLGLSLSS